VLDGDALLHHRCGRKGRRIAKPRHGHRRRPHGNDSTLKVARAVIGHQRLR
jgi:hypothetical protein